MSKMPTKVPPIIKATVPAVPAILNPEEYLAFEAIVEWADDVLEWHVELKTAIQKSRYATAEKLKDAQSALIDADERLESVADCRRQLARFNPKSAYDGKGRITMAQASVHIAAMVDGFPTKNAPDNFVDRLLLEVLAAKPSVLALESACRQILRLESDFMPGIGKVRAAIEEQKVVWSDRLWAIHTFAGMAKTLRDMVAEMTKILAAEQAKREEERLAFEEKKRVDDELRAQPLVAGDRVRHSGQLGAGTIIRNWSDEGECGRLDVLFDGGSFHWVTPSDVKRLIPGDQSFDVPVDKREEVDRKLAKERERGERNRRPVVGDRVTDDIYDWHDPENPPNGAGTVAFAGDYDPEGFDDGFTIQFDSGTLGVNFMASQLSRLLPTDPNFVAGAQSPLPNVSMDFPIDPADDDDGPPRSYFGGRLQP